MPEYFKVKYSQQRDVFVDGVKMGRTNRRIEVGRGTYTVNMGAPRDYRPKWRRATITGTDSEAPLAITFEKIEEEDA